MKLPVTIGVFTPYLHSNYYGKMIQGIHRCARELGVRLIIIQTTREHDNDNMPEEDSRIAADHVDGWIVVARSVSEAYIADLHTLGKPIAAVANETPGCLFVRSDNYGGMYEAVSHLIEAHGHRKIGFVGPTFLFDVMERFKGYRAALADHGITYGPGVRFDVETNISPRGSDVIRQLLDAGPLPFTAVAAGTDAIASGVVAGMNAAGMRVPDDLAVIGFDNSPMALQSDPPISTVEQPADTIGYVAMRRLYDTIFGEPMPCEPVFVSNRLVLRRSCGCSFAGRIKPEEELEDQRLQVKMLSHSISSTHAIGKQLIQANRDDIKGIGWLHHAGKPWGCLGLWSPEEPGTLRVDHLFDGWSKPVAVGTVPAEKFPPVELIPDELASPGGDHVITLHPVRSNTRYWGVLALIQSVRDIALWDEHDAMLHWYDLLASAIEREDLHEEIQMSGQRYRTIAEQLEIVSRTTNDGIWDYHLAEDRFDSNERMHNILGIDRDTLPSTAETFLSLIHPEDYPRFQAAMNGHLSDSVPFRIECRLRRGDGSYMWVYSAGEAIRNDCGEPIRMIGSIRDITGQRQAEEKIRNLAYHDPLTQLPNRLFFNDRLREQIVEAKRTRCKMGLLLIDLDRFKTVNDSFGHQVGDDLLVFVADQLVKRIPQRHILARLGGDEFIVLMPDIEDELEAVTLGHLVMDVLRVPFQIGAYEFLVTGSVGISLFPQHGQDVVTLVKSADTAMYQAKAEGKNNVKVYASAMTPLVQGKILLESDLRKALQRGEFSLHYQPQLDTNTGCVCGAEALLRWHSPERGSVAPADFIPMAEETGLIVPIGEWVLREACAQAAKWLPHCSSPFKMAVNISGHQFRLSDFAAHIRDILAEAALEPSRLCLEITETTAIHNIDLTIRTLEELIGLGVKIAVDDFGTGYSSLGLLKRMPIQLVKIDKSFIDDITSHEEEAAIVNAIIAMSHSLKLKVVAEGVEDNRQLSLLRSQTCDYVQGYLIGKPMPADEFERHFLTKRAAN